MGLAGSQLRWLDRELTTVDNSGRQAIIIGERPYGIDPESEESIWADSVRGVFAAILGAHCSSISALIFSSKSQSEARVLAGEELQCDVPLLALNGLSPLIPDHNPAVSELSVDFCRSNQGSSVSAWLQYSTPMGSASFSQMQDMLSWYRKADSTSVVKVMKTLLPWFRRDQFFSWRSDALGGVGVDWLTYQDRRRIVCSTIHTRTDYYWTCVLDCPSLTISWPTITNPQQVTLVFMERMLWILLTAIISLTSMAMFVLRLFRLWFTVKALAVEAEELHRFLSRVSNIDELTSRNVQDFCRRCDDCRETLLGRRLLSSESARWIRMICHAAELKYETERLRQKAEFEAQPALSLPTEYRSAKESLPGSYLEAIRNTAIVFDRLLDYAWRVRGKDNCAFLRVPSLELFPLPPRAIPTPQDDAGIDVKAFCDLKKSAGVDRYETWLIALAQVAETKPDPHVLPKELTRTALKQFFHEQTFWKELTQLQQCALVAKFQADPGTKFVPPPWWLRLYESDNNFPVTTREWWNPLFRPMNLLLAARILITLTLVAFWSNHTLEALGVGCPVRVMTMVGIFASVACDLLLIVGGKAPGAATYAWVYMWMDCIAWNQDENLDLFMMVLLFLRIALDSFIMMAIWTATRHRRQRIKGICCFDEIIFRCDLAFLERAFSTGKVYIAAMFTGFMYVEWTNRIMTLLDATIAIINGTAAADLTVSLPANLRIVASVFVGIAVSRYCIMAVSQQPNCGYFAKVGELINAIIIIFWMLLQYFLFGIASLLWLAIACIAVMYAFPDPDLKTKKTKSFGALAPWTYQLRRWAGSFPFYQDLLRVTFLSTLSTVVVILFLLWAYHFRPPGFNVQLILLLRALGSSLQDGAAVFVVKTIRWLKQEYRSRKAKKAEELRRLIGEAVVEVAPPPEIEDEFSATVILERANLALSFHREASLSSSQIHRHKIGLTAQEANEHQGLHLQDENRTAPPNAADVDADPLAESLLTTQEQDEAAACAQQDDPRSEAPSEPLVEARQLSQHGRGRH